jgi:hypothetical protein
LATQYSSWIIEAAGALKPFATVGDNEYDNLFLVTLKKNGTAKVRVWNMVKK